MTGTFPPKRPGPAAPSRCATPDRLPPLLALLVLLLPACGDRHPGAEVVPRVTGEVEASARPVADFAALSRGDTVLGLRVDSVSILPDPVDSFGWMGQIEYAGPVELVGEYRPHVDFPDVEEPCFFVDDSVAGRLPRFPNDVRRSWFCFANPREAFEQLGPPGSISRARIVIDHFHYHYQHSDVYNVARLAQVLERSPGP